MDNVCVFRLWNSGVYLQQYIKPQLKLLFEGVHLVLILRRNRKNAIWIFQSISVRKFSKYCRMTPHYIDVKYVILQYISIFDPDDKIGQDEPTNAP